MLQSTPENFDDHWRVSMGANYRVNDKWMVREASRTDESPVTTSTAPAPPHSDRVWLSIGAQLQAFRPSDLRRGLPYIFVDDSTDRHQRRQHRATLLRGN